MHGVSPRGGMMSSREHTEVAYAKVEGAGNADARSPDATGLTPDWPPAAPRKETVRVMISVRLFERFLEWRGSSVGRAYD
jgi:hypothetical protein